MGRLGGAREQVTDFFGRRLLLLFLFGFQWNVDVHSQLLAAKTKQLEWKLQHNNKEGANFYQKQNIKSTSCSYLLFVLFKEADDGGGCDVIARLIIAHQQLGLEENLQDLLQRLLKDNNNKHTIKSSIKWTKVRFRNMTQTSLICVLSCSCWTLIESVEL